MKFRNIVITSCICSLAASKAFATANTMAMTKESNPPEWPDSVIVVRDTEYEEAIKTKIQHTQDSWQHENGIPTFTCHHHFSDRRYAVLFAPGTYRNIDLEVGYYVQVAGLGTSSDDVQFLDGQGPYVPSLNRHIHENGTCLDTFWRSGENFAIHGNMTWAVSQASPLRRVHVTNDLFLHDKDAYASGGHIANAVVDGHTYFGGQQQYLSRNVKFGSGSSGGAWGMVYVGCENAPAASPGDHRSAAITSLNNTPIRIEKPYVAMYDDDSTKFQLRVPKLSHGNNNEPQVNGKNEESRDFSYVKVVKPNESTAEIQAALDDGKDVVLTPGIYNLDQTLQVQTANQIVLGLGLATLIAPEGTPCIQVEPHTPGVRIAGIMLEAPPIHPSGRVDTNNDNHWSLLEVGKEQVTDDEGNPENPIGLFDIFCRVGGGGSAEQRKWISIDTMVRIHSGHVIGDNLWLWRADHASLDTAIQEEVNCPEVSPVFYQTEPEEYNVDTGIIVSGNNVTIYGLAVEHTSKDQTVWTGDDGKVFFYQCEFPYDVDVDFGQKGYRGYKIGDNVKTHSLYSPGIYSNFRNAVVHVDTAIEHPRGRNNDITIFNPFTVHLDNNGLIKSIVNGVGLPAEKQGTPTRLV